MTASAFDDDEIETDLTVDDRIQFIGDDIETAADGLSEGELRRLCQALRKIETILSAPVTDDGDDDPF